MIEYGVLSKKRNIMNGDGKTENARNTAPIYRSGGKYG